MVGYTLSELAAADLAAIYAHTRQKYGLVQAGAYLASIEEALDIIAGFPGIAAEHPAFQPSIRVHPHGQHVILYTATDAEPLIVRVLGARQDWQCVLLSPENNP